MPIVIMENRFKKINIEEIPSGDYQGYYWLSNSSKPDVQYTGDIDKSLFNKLPFVIEANYYSNEKNISINVKNIDGKYVVSLIDVEGCEATEYIGHDIDSNFLVVEAWEDKQDNLLENLKTKVPSWVAFKGFVESKKSLKND
jgi:CRISPR type III-associated protein (TIGR04423 family)